FDDRDLAEIDAPDYPGERLIVCKNPLLAAERARKREDLLAATERALTRIQDGLRRRRKPVGLAQIGIMVGAVLDRHKLGKHIRIDVTERNFTHRRDREAIAAEARLDGFYVIPTSFAAASQLSPSAKAKRASKRTPQGLPGHSFHTLLRDLATCTINQTTIAAGKSIKADILARPTPIQAKAFELLSLDPNRTQ